jgi:hypothetical protein
MRKTFGLVLTGLLLLSGVMAAAPAAAARRHRVLRVGTWHGIPGNYKGLQKAVNAARPGDWILIGPGDHRPKGVKRPEIAGVLVRTSHLHIRGMNRNRVIIDGTKRHHHACTKSRHAQRLGPRDKAGKHQGRNGLEVYKANHVTLQNLTVCNFLASKDGGEGNQIWWNGGDGSGKIGMGAYDGSYLTATSSYSKGVNAPYGNYGIFVSNSRGPGLINRTYASNMADSDYYIGACRDCNAVLRHAHGQYSSLAVSMTNAGGHLIIEKSEFDHNKSGPTSNSQNNDDAPGPQNGHCPGKEKGPMGNGICEIWRHNYFHDNNNPNVPGNGSGLAGGAPVGTGAILAGTEYIMLKHNRIEHNGSWGVLVADLPDQENPPPISHCEGGTYIDGGQVCYYQAFGNRVMANNFSKHNGFFGNPTNGDVGLATNEHNPGNCFHANKDPNGFTSDPPNIQSTPWYPCNQPNNGDLGPLLVQAECAGQLFGPCPNPPQAEYPRPTKVVLHLPHRKPTMPHPCAGVPTNPWCPKGR